MTQELRIRDSRPDRLDGRGTAHPPVFSDSELPRDAPEQAPGEAAWDLAEPFPAQALGPDEPDPRSKVLDEPFLPFPGMPGEEEEPPKGPGLDLERFARGILKRIWLAAGIAFVVASLFVVGAVVMIKPKWEASAALMLRPTRDQFSLGGTKPLALQDYNLKTLLDTVKLPSSLQAVLSALDLQATERSLSAAIGVSIGKESNIFQISAVWKDPVVAANVANKVAELLVQRSRDMRRKDAEDAYSNYGAQLEAARRDLLAINADIRAFKATHRFTDPKAELQVLLGSLASLEAELNTKSAEVQAYKEVLGDIEKAVKSEPEMVVSSTIYRNPLKSRLTEYEWQLQEARSRYTEQNPKVIKLQSRVDVLKQMLAESKDEGAPENQYTANAKLSELQSRQRALESEIRVREAQITALTQTLQEGRTKLAQLTSAEKDYQQLEERKEAADALVNGLVGRVGEAEVMMQRNEAALELVEAARPPSQSAPSPKRLIAMAGVVVGGGLGLMVALLLELLDPPLRTRRDALGILWTEPAWELQHIPGGESGVLDGRRPTDPVGAAFRRLINELEARLEPADWDCLAVLSADAAAGRSLVATHLAIALAVKECPTVLVDADLRGEVGRRPGQLLNTPEDRPGLFSALTGDAWVTSLLTETNIPGLAVLPVGRSPGERASDALRRKDSESLRGTRGPHAEPPTGQAVMAGFDSGLEQLGSRRFRSVVESLRQLGRHIVVDLPPVDSHETVLEAAALLGNVLLVARSGQTTRKHLREAIAVLDERGAKIRGILVTDVPFDLLQGKPLFHPGPRRHFWSRWSKDPDANQTGPASSHR